MNTRRLLLAALVVLAGCAHTQSQNEGYPAPVDKVVIAIKKDLLQYQEYRLANRENPALPNACAGKVDYDIQSVKIQLTTVTDDKVGVSGSLTLPVGGGAGTVGPILGTSKETKGTQTLEFSLIPAPASPAGRAKVTAPPPAIDAGVYPIAAALQQLRENLLKASNTAPCFKLASDDPKTPSGTFTFGFTVINDTPSGLNVKFVVFSIGATSDRQRQTGNAITVSFRAIGGTAFQ